ncbi:thiamine pyrophosphate-binding protein [Alphaproteobacteria bacterium]|nr:thiamine pyrophosphate-binding protein [Alphaproteobacteria bacterium]
MRVADFVIQYLKNKNIKTFFSVTGRGSLFLNDALARDKDVKSFFFHHEQSAAFAAITTPHIDNNISCCMVSTGCASTNTITAVLSAWQDSLPVIFISGQNFLNETTNYNKKNIRTYGQQEANIIEIIKPITKYSKMVTDPLQIKYELDKAFFFANDKIKGPVWLDIPLDIQNSRLDEEKLKSFSKNHEIKKCSYKLIRKVFSEIKVSNRPVVLIGSGIKNSKCIDEFREFVNKYKIPVVYTSSGSSILGSEYKFSIGSVGSQGCSREGAFTVQNSDLLLVLGSRLNSLTIGSDAEKFARNAKKIIIDIEKEEYTKNKFDNSILILSDLGFFLKKMNKKKIKIKWGKWNQKCLNWKKFFEDKKDLLNISQRTNLYELSEVFSKTLAMDSIFLCDSGFIDVILPTNINFKKNQICIHPVSQGSMGFALPAIIGAHSTGRKDIVSVIGDGSIMMNLQELQTIKDYKIPAKIFIINNRMYGIIRRRQKELFRGRTIGTDDTNGLGCPDFKKISKAFGIKYKLIKTKKNLKNEINSILKQKKTVICEIMADENQEYIEIGYAKNAEGKIVRRPLEDQKPFLDRNIFLKQMLIEPIDQ